MPTGFNAAATLPAQWPIGEAMDVASAEEEELTDERHWPAGVHAGLRRVMRGSIAWPETTA